MVSIQVIQFQEGSLTDHLLKNVHRNICHLACLFLIVFISNQRTAAMIISAQIQGMSSENNCKLIQTKRGGHPFCKARDDGCHAIGCPGAALGSCGRHPAAINKSFQIADIVHD